MIPTKNNSMKILMNMTNEWREEAFVKATFLPRKNAMNIMKSELFFCIAININIGVMVRDSESDHKNMLVYVSEDCLFNRQFSMENNYPH